MPELLKTVSVRLTLAIAALLGFASSTLAVGALERAAAAAMDGALTESVASGAFSWEVAPTEASGGSGNHFFCPPFASFPSHLDAPLQRWVLANELSQSPAAHLQAGGGASIRAP